MIIDWSSISNNSPQRQMQRTLLSLLRLGVHIFLLTTDRAELLGETIGKSHEAEGQIFTFDRDEFCEFPAEHHWRGVSRPSSDPEHNHAFVLTCSPFEWLEQQGITGSLIALISASEDLLSDFHRPDAIRIARIQLMQSSSISHEPARNSTQEFHQLLKHQEDRWLAKQGPRIDEDPSWIVKLPGSGALARVAESLGALANGWTGTRASSEARSRRETPLFAISGMYDDNNRLMRGPNWPELNMQLELDSAQESRVLDLRTGVLARGNEHSPIRALRLISTANPYILAQRFDIRASRLAVQLPQETTGLQVSCESGPAIAVSVDDRHHVDHERFVIDRVATWAVGQQAEEAAAQSRLRLRAQGDSFDRILARHRAAWSSQWKHANIWIDGDPDMELAARFAVFHLLGAAKNTDESAVGARGLTGEAYSGHVFWDADIFVLPVLAAIAPDKARSMLQYRVNRLPAAHYSARFQRRSGARFPWESAHHGFEVSPRKALAPNGAVIPIRTGLREEHITADIAWAAEHYASWTDDMEFSTGPGDDLVVETGRYWASRIRRDSHGRGHIYGVIGPDEYHDVVDDNMYTNVMARWNLRAAAKRLADRNPQEASLFFESADCLIDGYHEETGIYEQFAGYDRLESLKVADFSQVPVAADLVLGRERVAESQIIKQADVLMAHHLIPDEMAPGSLAACLAFYEPKTSHGSSLSPAISASCLARAGDVDRALELLRISARIDLDDLTSTTAGGLHLAAMGGIWQALAFGFLGLKAEANALRLEPRLPSSWSSLEMCLSFRGRDLQIRATPDEIVVHSSHELTLVCGAERHNVDSEGLRFCAPF